MPPLDAAVGDQVERAEAFGDAGRMIVTRRGQADAVPDADVLGALGYGAEENLRRGGVRILFQEMMLDFPHVIEAEPVGEFDLVESVVEQLLLRTLHPGLRKLMFIEHSELHGFLRNAGDPLRSSVLFLRRAVARQAPDLTAGTMSCAV
nr:hypothetical protein [Mesorhizobium sp. J428]